jgi:predicted RNase H-like HicB family nuclease
MTGEREITCRLERDEDGFWVATCPRLPGCISQGATAREARANWEEARRAYQDCLAAYGEQACRPEGAE